MSDEEGKEIKVRSRYRKGRKKLLQSNLMGNVSSHEEHKLYS
jgi:hypothetical protein